MELSKDDHYPNGLLRQRAEEALRGQPVDLGGLSSQDIQSLLHELQVYHVEMSMQNDELRRVQLELEASRDRYSDLYNFAPAGFCTLNHKGEILEANHTLEDLLGVEPGRLIHNPLSRFVDRDDQDTYYLHRRQAFDTRQPQVCEIRMVKQTGERFDVRLESLITHHDENTIRVVLSDITKYRQAEEALRETQNRLRLALENTPISVYTTDRELRYTWVYNSLYGLPPEAILARRDDELLPAEQTVEMTALKQAVLESEIGQRREVRLRVGAEILVYDITVEPLCRDHGEVVGLRVASIDLTKQRRMEQAEQETAARQKVQHLLIEQREKERVQIARDLHDGPLQELFGTTFRLKGLAASLGECPDGDEVRTVLETIQHQIDELRTFATELRPPLLIAFGVARAIQAHAGTLQTKLPGLTIHLQLDEGDLSLPENLRLTLYRIYQEAVNNILKHAQASQAWVRFKTGGRIAVLEIRDNGVGFTPPKQWLTLARQGHLGLVGMQERAEAVGGTMQIQSNPGQGTTLQITVPVSGDPPAMGETATF